MTVADALAALHRDGFVEQAPGGSEICVFTEIGGGACVYQMSYAWDSGALLARCKTRQAAIETAARIAAGVLR